MAVEKVTIIDSGPASVTIAARNVDHCGRCTLKAGCGHQLLQEYHLARRAGHHLELPLPAGRKAPWRAWRKGDTVELAIDETRLVAMSLFQYLLPLLCVMIVTALADAWAGLDEGWVVLAAVAALGAGLAVVSHAGRHLVMARLPRLRLPQG